MLTKPRRHDLIARLVAERTIQSQHDLLTALATKRVQVNQATLSRDLQEMGVLKGPEGYLLPSQLGLPAQPSAARTEDALSARFRRELRSIEYSGNTVVMRTDAGHANALAVEIDRSRFEDVLGTIAGDDTIFILVRRGKSAARLTRRFREMASFE